jgi:hypothetical protein
MTPRDRQSSLEQPSRGGEIALGLKQNREGVEAGRGARMFRAQDPFPDGESALEQRPRRAIGARRVTIGAEALQQGSTTFRLDLQVLASSAQQPKRHRVKPACARPPGWGVVNSVRIYRSECFDQPAANRVRRRAIPTPFRREPDQPV